MKKLTQKKKIKIAKIFFGTYAFLIYAYIGGMVYLDYLVSENSAYYDFYTGAGIGLIIFIVVCLILFYTFGSYLENTTNFKHSYQYDFEYKDFPDLNEDIKNKLLKEKYNLPIKYNINDKEEVYIYLKKSEDKEIEIWIVSNLISVTKEKANKLSKILKEFLTKYVGKEKVKLKKGLHLVCVKRYSMEFESLVKDTFISYGPTLTVGLSFSKRKIYIPKAKEVFATVTDNYDYLKEEFFKVVDRIEKKK